MIKAQNQWIKPKDTPWYQVGDQVWLDGRNLHTAQPTAKLAPRCQGPFLIEQVLSPITYRLTLPTQWRIHPVFHADLLTPYHETPIHGQNYTRPPPDLVDGAEEYEVEKIPDKRRKGRGGKLQYLVKWKGYPDSDNEWVDRQDVHAPEEISRYEERVQAHKSRAASCKEPHPIHLMSSSPTSSIIFIVTTSADDATAHHQAMAHHARDLVEALACFPTPEPGHVSPNSTQTRYHSLDQTTGIRDGSRGPEGMEGAGTTVEGRADSEGPGEMASPTRIEIVECKCDSFLNTGEFCDRCQGRGCDERDECTCGRKDDQCICVGRCPADWPDDCTFRTTQKVCRTHGNHCMGCDRLLRECTCEHDEVYIPNPDILCRIPLAVGTIRRHDAARAACRATCQRCQEAEEDTVVDDSEEDKEGEPRERRVPNYQHIGDDELAEEFWENTPPRYMPFKICHKGRIQEARYVTIRYESDPITYGTMGGGIRFSNDLPTPLHVCTNLRHPGTPTTTPVSSTTTTPGRRGWMMPSSASTTTAYRLKYTGTAPSYGRLKKRRCKYESSKIALQTSPWKSMPT